MPSFNSVSPEYTHPPAHDGDDLKGEPSERVDEEEEKNEKETLLESSDLPSILVVEETPPRKVFLHYQVGFLPEIDTSTMTWHCQILFSCSWEVRKNEDPGEGDEHLDVIQKQYKDKDQSEYQKLVDWGRSTDNSESNFDRNGNARAEESGLVDKFLHIFDPKLYLVNLMGKRADAVQEVIVSCYRMKDGTLSCRYLWRVMGDFKTAMQLRSFPFDTTTLEIEIMTQHPQHIATLEDESLRNPKKYNAISASALKYSPVEWDIFKHKLYTGGEIKGSEDSNYSKVDLAIFIRRLPGFYVFKIFVPNYLLCSMSCCAVLMDSYADQINMLLTVILTESAYQIVISSTAPSGLPYNTNADQFIAMCLFYNVIIFVLCTVGFPAFNFTPLWMLNEDDKYAEHRFEDETKLRNLFLSLWGLWTFLCVCWCIYTIGPKGQQFTTRRHRKPLTHDLKQIHKDKTEGIYKKARRSYHRNE